MPIVPIVAILILLLAIVFVALGVMNLIFAGAIRNGNDAKVAVFYLLIGVVLLFASHWLFGMGHVNMLKVK